MDSSEVMAYSRMNTGSSRNEAVVSTLNRVKQSMDNFVNECFKLSGTIDLWIASIPLGEYSVPLDAWGFYEYFNEVKKSNRLIKYLDDNFAEGWMDESSSYRNPMASPYYAEVLAKRDALYDLVNSYKATPTQLRSMPPVIMQSMPPRAMTPNSGNWEKIVLKLANV